MSINQVIPRAHQSPFARSASNRFFSRAQQKVFSKRTLSCYSPIHTNQFLPQTHQANIFPGSHQKVSIIQLFPKAHQSPFARRVFQNTCEAVFSQYAMSNFARNAPNWYFPRVPTNFLLPETQQINIFPERIRRDYIYRI